MISAFVLVCNNCGDTTPSYCGYDSSNTGYRISVALISLILAVLLILRVWERASKICYFVLLAHGILWFSAIVFDAAILTNTTLACSNKDFFNDSSVSYTCDNTVYGKFNLR
jgi:hypothetical protein